MPRIAWFVRGGVEAEESAHAVADDGDFRRVGAVLLGVGGIAQEGDRGLRVFDGVAEGELAGAAPGAAIVRDEDVPPGAADGVGEIHVLFVAGKSVEKQDDGMRAGAGCEVEDGVEARVVADDVGRFHCGWEVFVARWIGDDRGGDVLRIRADGADARGGATRSR